MYTFELMSSNSTKKCNHHNPVQLHKNRVVVWHVEAVLKWIENKRGGPKCTPLYFYLPYLRLNTLQTYDHDYDHDVDFDDGCKTFLNLNIESTIPTHEPRVQPGCVAIILFYFLYFHCCWYFIVNCLTRTLVHTAPPRYMRRVQRSWRATYQEMTAATLWNTGKYGKVMT